MDTKSPLLLALLGIIVVVGLLAQIGYQGTPAGAPPDRWDQGNQPVILLKSTHTIIHALDLRTIRQ